MRPEDPITALAASPLLDELNNYELRVYMRLLGAAAPPRAFGEWMPIINSELHHHPKTTVKALARLEELGLIAIKRITKRPGRMIRVLR